MPICYLTLKLNLPYCHSLKEKRSSLKSCIIRVRKKFNISVAELDFQNSWHSSQIGIVWICNHSDYGVKLKEDIQTFINSNYPEIEILAELLEVF